MRKYNTKELKDKIYLSKLSMTKYREYYFELLRNVEFIVADYTEDKLANYKNINFADKKIYIKREYLESASTIRISMDLMKALEKHFEDIGIFDKKKQATSNKSIIDVDNNSAIDETDGKRQEEKKFWENKIDTTTKRMCSSGKWDKVPGRAKLKFDNIKSESIDWQKELKEFLLKDTSDYSFTPPDRRYTDSPLFLPAYNKVDEDLKNILFMFDTSSSMNKATISKVFNEVKNVTYQFRGNMRGYAGSFDTKVYDVKEFNSMRDIEDLKLSGEGGTSFKCIFEYINNKVRDITFNAIVILTDGAGEYPYIWEVNDIPVLWVMTKENKAPFGKSISIVS